MLLTPIKEPFNKDGYVAQPKKDGSRLLAIKKSSQINLINRRNINKNIQFPEIIEALRKYKTDFIIDGEVHIKDDFNLLAKREHLKDINKINRLKKINPVEYTVFDILNNGIDIMNKPYRFRYDELKKIINKGGVISVIENHSDCIKLFNEMKEKGKEGIVIRSLSSPYSLNFRSPTNFKCKAKVELKAIFSSYIVNKNGFLKLKTDDNKVACCYDLKAKEIIDKKGSVVGVVECQRVTEKGNWFQGYVKEITETYNPRSFLPK